MHYRPARRVQGVRRQSRSSHGGISDAPAPDFAALTGTFSDGNTITVEVSYRKTEYRRTILLKHQRVT
jgi:hypothetical protein